MSAPTPTTERPPLVFSLDWKKEPVEVGGRRYFLVQASGAAAVRYRDATISAARMVDGKLSSWQGITEAEPLLVSMCLYDANAEGGLELTPWGAPDPKRLVNVTTIKSWPQEVQKALYARVREISHLGEEAETPELLQKQIDTLTARRDTLLTERRRNGNGEDTAGGNDPKAWPGAGSLS